MKNKTKAMISLLEKYTGKKVQLKEEPCPISLSFGLIGKKSLNCGEIVYRRKKIIGTWNFDKDNNCYWATIEGREGQIAFTTPEELLKKLLLEENTGPSDLKENVMTLKIKQSVLIDIINSSDEGYELKIPNNSQAAYNNIVYIKSAGRIIGTSWKNISEFQTTDKDLYLFIKSKLK